MTRWAKPGPTDAALRRDLLGSIERELGTLTELRVLYAAVVRYLGAEGDAAEEGPALRELERAATRAERAIDFRDGRRHGPPKG